MGQDLVSVVVGHTNSEETEMTFTVQRVIQNRYIDEKREFWTGMVKILNRLMNVLDEIEEFFEIGWEKEQKLSWGLGLPGASCTSVCATQGAYCADYEFTKTRAGFEEIKISYQVLSKVKAIAIGEPQPVTDLCSHVSDGTFTKTSPSISGQNCFWRSDYRGKKRCSKKEKGVQRICP